MKGLDITQRGAEQEIVETLNEGGAVQEGTTDTRGMQSEHVRWAFAVTRQ